MVPVILSPSSYSDEDFAKLENLPRKGEPVSSFNPREEAWALVEEGIKRSVEQSRRLPKGLIPNLQMVESER